MVEIRPLAALDEPLLRHVIVGYSTTEVYQVTREESGESIQFTLRLITLPQPFVKRHPLDAERINYYRELATAGHAFGAFVERECVGVALCEPQQWNRSLAVQEFHIAPAYQHMGIGRQLMAAVEAHARTLGMRCIVCETQNTNVPAIRFYRALGFTLDSIDVSLYSNDDLTHGEVALFMKKRLD